MRPALVALLLAALASPAAAAPTLDALVERAGKEELHLLRGWQRLGHWRPTRSGGFVSDVDGPDFFLAKGGARDPAAELSATLRALFEAGPPEDLTPEARKGWRHPQCRFPARLAFLSGLLPLAEAGLPRVRCPTLETWVETLDPGGATLVFAASYLNSPASMYGHTFLRVDRADGGPELLSYAVSYAAVPWTEFPPLYAILGLTGGFPGRFTSSPYYLQVQTYSEVEFRDIWEYELSLTPRQVRQLVLHAWELGQTFIDYWFLDENCSFHLLALIEAAVPEVRLTDRFNLYTVPIDTARALLEQAGLVRAIRRRPSHVARMQARREQLGDDEWRLVEAIVREGLASRREALSALPEARQALVLDSAHDLFVYRRGLHDRFGERADTPKRRAERAEVDALVLARAKLRLPTPETPLPPPVRPDHGHDSARLAGDVGLDGGGPFLRAMVRPAYHDPTDPQEGFDADTALEFFATRAELRPHLAPDPDALLLSMDLIRISSLTPVGRWIRQPSWRIRWSGGIPLDRPCREWRCAEVRLDGGPGVAWRPFGDARYTLAAYADLDLALTPGLPAWGRLGARVEGAAFMSPTRAWRSVVRLSYRHDLVGGDDPTRRGAIRTTLEQALRISEHHTLRLALELDDERVSARIGFAQYF
ncbi:MAG: DUF4105 domain-containing protein [Deltaproteobacteria bacterium]|nr:DUF4105 domain-containing protein [Deltaproteobacteria bacterium]